MTTKASTVPQWIGRVLDLGELVADEHQVLRPVSAVARSEDQHQTAGTFSFKWSLEDTFNRPEFRQNSGHWYIEKYGPVTDDAWWAARSGRRPVVVEIGCGSGISAEYLVGPRLADIDYLGVDISDAISAARTCLRGLGGDPWFLQMDVLKAPLVAGGADLVFSEGVLHHTDSTEQAVDRAASLVAPGGRLAFYVYKKKAACREFIDDHVRAIVSELSEPDAWERLMPLTKLGKALGDLDATVTVPEDVTVLDIPAGTYDVQRLFYWFFCKAYYRPEFTLDEMNHINFDWYMPRNCHRHTPDEVRGWIDRLGFTVDWFREEEAGITVVASRPT